VVFESPAVPAPAGAEASRASASVITRIILAQYVLQHRCGRVQAEFTSTRRWALALRPEHHPRSDQSDSRTRRAASMQDTLSEGTARAAQLAPSAVTASAVGGSATRSVVADSLRRRAARARSTHARAIARRRGCFLGCVSCKFSHFKFGQQSSLFQDISGFLKNERKREKRRW
jgi:hypothetical protein